MAILEEARQKYRFVVQAYVVMPEHSHLLSTEPEVGDASVAMKVIKEHGENSLTRTGETDWVGVLRLRNRFTA